VGGDVEDRVVEVGPGVMWLTVRGRSVLCVDCETWLAHGRPRWTPGRRSEVLAESVLCLPGRECRVRLQAYIGSGMSGRGEW
jgi:hypothetical protein